MADLDLNALVEEAEGALIDAFGPTWDSAIECRMTEASRAALAVIVPAITAQFRALHPRSESNPGEAGRQHQEAGPWLGDCEACWLRHPCPTVHLCDELDALVRGEQG